MPTPEPFRLTGYYSTELSSSRAQFLAVTSGTEKGNFS